MDKTLSLDLQQTDFGRGLDKEIKRLDGRIDTETDARSAADQEIWTEIEAIEAASDVVDVVGTYAELEDYDTSALKDNDIIKVLQDETHDDAVAYCRWDSSTEAFAFVGVEGPYYTASETDTLLAGKQDKLIAGSNIQIAADGKTISATGTTYSAGTNVQISADNVISATDTTYSAFTGATSSAAGVSGLVPAPTVSDSDKFLKGDGTWSTPDDKFVVLYTKAMLHTTGGGGHTVTGWDDYLYTDAQYTNKLTHDAWRTLMSSSDSSDVWLRMADQYREYTLKLVSRHNVLDPYYNDDGGTFFLSCPMTGLQISLYIYLDYEDAPYRFMLSDVNLATFNRFSRSSDGLVPASTTMGDDTKFLKGDGTWATPTDTTYSDFTGATSSAAGTAGLVPAPAAGDETKFLAGDGTWQTVSGGGSYSAGYGINISANNEISADQTVLALRTDLVGKQDVLTAGSNITISGNTISATDTTYSAMTGATSSVAGAAGLVPAPTTSDPDKFLKGDGTWGTVSTDPNVVEVYKKYSGYTFVGFYYDQAGTEWVGAENLYDLVKTSTVLVRTGTAEDVYMIISASEGAGSDYDFVASNGLGWTKFNLCDDEDNPGTYLFASVYEIPAQERLTAGSNITISNQNVISATDTTYSDFGGATSSVAGSAGLVPAPTTSDPDKYLKGDGTWSTLPAANNISSTDWNGLWQ